MTIPRRTVPVETTKSQIRLQGEWFDHELIEELLETDGYFSFVIGHFERWDADSKRMIAFGQMGELKKRGLVAQSARGGWYATDTLKQLVKGQGGLS